MSESTDPQTRAVPTPEEMPWSISYLRDDIKDLRTQVGALHERIDETNRSLGDRIDDALTRPTARWATALTRPTAHWANKFAHSISAWTPISFG